MEFLSSYSLHQCAGKHLVGVKEEDTSTDALGTIIRIENDNAVSQVRDTR